MLLAVSVCVCFGAFCLLVVCGFGVVVCLLFINRCGLLLLVVVRCCWLFVDCRGLWVVVCLFMHVSCCLLRDVCCLSFVVCVASWLMVCVAGCLLCVGW